MFLMTEENHRYHPSGLSVS